MNKDKAVYERINQGCPHCFILSDQTAECASLVMKDYFEKHPKLVNEELALCLSCFSVMPLEAMAAHYKASLHTGPEARSHSLCLTTQSCVIYCVGCNKGLHTTPPTPLSVSNIINKIRNALCKANGTWEDPPQRSKFIEEDLKIPQKLVPLPEPEGAPHPEKAAPKPLETTPVTPMLTPTPSSKKSKTAVSPVSPVSPLIQDTPKKPSKEAKTIQKQSAKEVQSRIENSEAANQLAKLRALQAQKSKLESPTGPVAPQLPTGVALIKRLQQGVTVRRRKGKKEIIFTLTLDADKTTVQLRDVLKNKVDTKFSKADVKAVAPCETLGLAIKYKHHELTLLFAAADELCMWRSFLGK